MSTSLSTSSLSNIQTQPVNLNRNGSHALNKSKRVQLNHIKVHDAQATIHIPKLKIDSAVSYINDPVPTWGHKEVSSKREHTNLGGSVFSLFVKTSTKRAINQPPEYDTNFMSLIEEIEKYMYDIVSAMVSSDLEQQEDMRQHKKFIEDAIDDLERLEHYFGYSKFGGASYVNFKKFKPVDLDVDESADRY